MIRQAKALAIVRIIRYNNSKLPRGASFMETKYYVLTSIDGDYAWLTCTSAQEEPYFIARALLPMEADEGSKLKFENFQFEIV